MAKRSKPLSGDKRYVIYIRDEKGRFSRARKGALQSITVKDRKTGETFKFDKQRTKSVKYIRNIGGRIGTFVEKLRRGFIKSLFGRKFIEPSIRPIKAKKLKREVDKKRGTVTDQVEFVDRLYGRYIFKYILQNYQEKKVQFYYYYWLFQNPETGVQTPTFSGVIDWIPNDDDLIAGVDSMMESNYAGINFSFREGSDPQNMLFVKTILRVSYLN